ncbi:MAG: hypothetical protein EAZ78_17740 [Oscillatoriales cyanobacterium]|nr:MAG: hypothetical protein EA000_17715 [Oscillatoriales cyanobacterium]TAD95295.1 MAG: hypothetical protein EAZ98_16175 [Oscillatoriales cyanobacterium]TAE00976.1 MAG: hypothetical protein EAZ96_20110 [Oscillatoriales cyanobacterium]TAF01602.1 MAG: hypothetical protein EAZ78_17740 [Oscillatoriales cyanobacterium]TAF40288.1 MAG: hypothetical protein EAZ68_11280 [Oscillatoriales cyanobacterium]
MRRLAIGCSQNFLKVRSWRILSRIKSRAWGIGHWVWGIGHWALFLLIAPRVFLNPEIPPNPP